nr:MAG TPA: hypothetical protein [Bacteriophage sp.]
MSREHLLHHHAKQNNKRNPQGFLILYHISFSHQRQTHQSHT